MLLFQISCWSWSCLRRARSSLIFSHCSVGPEEANNSVNIQFFPETLMPDVPSPPFLSAIAPLRGTALWGWQDSYSHLSFRDSGPHWGPTRTGFPADEPRNELHFMACHFVIICVCAIYISYVICVIFYLTIFISWITIKTSLSF